MLVPSKPMNRGTPQKETMTTPERKDYELDYYARNTVAELRRQLAAQSRYIAELEKQLEPSVVAEIREELSEQQQ